MNKRSNLKDKIILEKDIIQQLPDKNQHLNLDIKAKNMNKLIFHDSGDDSD